MDSRRAKGSMNLPVRFCVLPGQPGILARLASISRLSRLEDLHPLRCTTRVYPMVIRTILVPQQLEKRGTAR